jgi:hypothetical protein
MMLSASFMLVSSSLLSSVALATPPATAPRALTPETAREVVRTALVAVNEPLSLLDKLQCERPAERCALETTQPDANRLATLLDAVQDAAQSQRVGARVYLVGLESSGKGGKTGEIMLFPESGEAAEIMWGAY